MSKIGSAVLTVLVFVFMILSLFLAISGYNIKNKSAFLGYNGVIVLSDSMVPTFDRGSILVTKQVTPDEINVGDILTYRPMKRDQDVLLTHRVIEVIQADGKVSSFITQGDANETADPDPVNPDTIVGVTALYVRFIGHIFLFLQTPIGVGVAVGVIVLLILFSWVGKKEKKENEGENDEKLNISNSDEKLVDKNDSDEEHKNTNIEEKVDKTEPDDDEGSQDDE